MRAWVIAMESEAACVRPFLKAGDELVVSGVGKVNAAMAAQRMIDAGADEILNVGVVGGLDPSMDVGDVYEVSQAVEYDFDLAAVNGTRPGVLNERTTPYFDCRTVGVFPARILATGDRFTDDESDLPLLAELKATLRDMEGAAIAHVCERAGVAFRSLKCVSDVRGKGAMTAQYRDNLERTLECLQRAVTSWM